MRSYVVAATENGANGNSVYRGANKGLCVLLSSTQAGPGRTVNQEREEISRNRVQTFISPSVQQGSQLETEGTS